MGAKINDSPKEKSVCYGTDKLNNLYINGLKIMSNLVSESDDKTAYMPD